MEFLLGISILLNFILFSRFLNLKKELETSSKKVDDLESQINKLNFKTCSRSLTLLLKDRDFDNIKVGTKFINLTDLWADEPVFINRILVQLPDSKYQLVKVDKTGKVLGSTNMGIVDTLDEVIVYIKQYPYAVVEY